MIVSANLSQSIKRMAKRLLGVGSAAPDTAQPIRRQIYSIGVYAGGSPFELAPADVRNPVLTGESVTDVPASFVADPFAVQANGIWYMFFEVFNDRSGRGEIGLATSPDGLQWTYQQIVLREPVHLSYPYTFEWQNAFYMVPESYEAKSVRLYRALDFPRRWSLHTVLLEGDDFVDPSIFHFNGRWWLFADLARSPYYAGVLRLYHADDLKGPWIEHPKSPVIEGDPHIARPAGRVTVVNDRVIRYSQDCCPEYGQRVRAFAIEELTVASYREQALEPAPVLDGSGTDWNAHGMHHVDPHQLASGQWLAYVDGYRWKELSCSSSK